jgi:hypothetical protein
MLHDHPSGTDARLWPYFLAAYAGLASTVPWLSGGFSEGELALKYSAFLGAIFALPVGLSAAALSQSAYRAIAVEFAVLVALWGIHFLLSLGFAIRKQRASAEEAPRSDRSDNGEP